jgi:hypothetical protein
MHMDGQRTQVSKAARRLLDTELEQLIEVSSARLRSSAPEYGSVGEKSLAEPMRKNITLTLLRISGDEVPEDLATAAYETGRLRAIQRVDLTAVSQSFRLDLRVLWEAFLRDAQVHGLDMDAGYMGELLSVWEAVEANINEMTEGYRATAEKLKQQNSELRMAAFQRLLDMGGDASEAAVSKQLSSLSFDPSAPLFCIVSDLRESDYAELFAIQTRLGQRRITGYFGWQSQHLVGLVQAPGLTREVLLDLLARLGGFRTAIAEVPAPTSLAAAIRNAQILVAATDSPGLRPLRDNWLTAVSYAEPMLVEALVEQLFAPFRDLSDYAREELTRVIEGFLSTNGSILAISQAIFRHRNTVRNRLAQVEELTGLQLGTPHDAALLALAFESWRREGAKRW